MGAEAGGRQASCAAVLCAGQTGPLAVLLPLRCMHLFVDRASHASSASKTGSQGITLDTETWAKEPKPGARMSQSDGPTPAGGNALRAMS